MTVKRTIAPVIRTSRLGELDEQAERRAYWAAQPMAARIAEVEVLRRMWIELTGDPDQPSSAARGQSGTERGVVTWRGARTGLPIEHRGRGSP